VIIIRFVHFDVQSEGKPIEVHDDMVLFAVVVSIACCDLFYFCSKLHSTDRWVYWSVKGHI